jgi:hypothetical protein
MIIIPGKEFTCCKDRKRVSSCYVWMYDFILSYQYKVILQLIMQDVRVPFSQALFRSLQQRMQVWRLRQTYNQMFASAGCCS